MGAVLAQAASAFRGPDVDWYALSPLLVLLGAAMGLLVVAALAPAIWRRGWYAFVTATAAGAAIVLAVLLWNDVRDDGARSLVGGAVVLDGFSLFTTVIICSAVLLTALFADDYLRREDLDGPELYGLLLLSAVGAVVMGSADDLIVVFLGLETLSLALYVMAAMHRRRLESQESAMKYFVLGSFSSAFLLYGIALVYGSTGTTRIAGIVDVFNRSDPSDKPVLLAGLALLLVGLGFKVAAVPFHSWAPDVYQGAPTPVSGFMASAAKAAGFAALLRVFVVGMAALHTDWRPVVWVIAVITLVFGSVAALVQTDVKRMLAYSSINHAGFVLIGVEAGTARGTAAALAYLLIYAFMVLGSFGVVALVARRGDGATGLDAYRGLSRTRPVLALVFTIFLLAQAGVPLTSGFVAKFSVITAAVDADSFALAIIAMLTSAVAAFVYLRIVVAMYLSDPAEAPATSDGEVLGPVHVPLSAGVGLALALGVTVLVGFLPGLVIDPANDAVPVVAAGAPAP